MEIEGNNYVIIMAGGIGSRFWPYSRNGYPKQFLDVMGVGRSLLQLTFDRFTKICSKENIYIVSNEKYADLIREQLPGLADYQILLEPDRRNTAPCIAYAAYKIAQRDPKANMVVTPADHVIFKEDVFEETINQALEASKNSDKLITIGIKPTRPETGYGYIQYIQDENSIVKKVKTFTEKPILELAQKFIESGDFVWNAGIFIWRADTIIRSFEKHLPDISELFSSMSDSYFSDREKGAIENAYAVTKSISIDYGVMEKADNVYVVEGNFGWSDLGSWSSLHDIRNKNGDNNVIDANTLTYDCKNCLIMGEKERLIVIQGLEGYLVADCEDVLLICKKDDEKQFRSFVNDVKNEKGEKFV